jgi:hypothetical protein
VILLTGLCLIIVTFLVAGAYSLRAIIQFFIAPREPVRIIPMHQSRQKHIGVYGILALIFLIGFLIHVLH